MNAIDKGGRLTSKVLARNAPSPLYSCMNRCAAAVISPLNLAMNTKTISIIFALLSGTLGAWSQSPLYWAFDTAHFVVQPDESITVSATVFNPSEVPYTIAGGGVSFGGDLQKIYFATGIINLSGQTVPAFGSFQFNFVTLTPIEGTVAPGIYYADPAGMNFAAIDDPQHLIISQNTFDITVVPEPTSASLFGLMGAGLYINWLRSRRQQAVRG